MEKKLLFILLTFMPLSMVADEISHTFSCDNIEYTVIGDGIVSMGSVNGSDYFDVFVLPDTVYEMDKSYTVVRIDAGGSLMQYNGIVMGGSLLKGIHADTLFLPKTLKEIKYRGLSYMSSFRIIIPEGLEEMGDYAFADCYNLESINFPDRLTVIPDGAFSGCKNLETIKIPDSVTEIGTAAFSECKKLASIMLPSSVQEIQWYAFSGCSSLASIKIPDGITEIQEKVFSGCTSLADITIPTSVTTIGSCAFHGSGLGSIEIPNNVTSLGDSAFAACKYLRRVRLSESLMYIPPGAFRGSLITSINIPEVVERIGYKAFNECDYLTTIIVNSTTPPQVKWEETFSNYNATVYVPKGSRSAYERAQNWSRFANIVEQEEEPTSFYLIVAQPSGIVGIEVKEGNRQKLLFTPDAGYRIHSITYNDVDITSLIEADGTFTTPTIHADSRVAVVFEQDLQGITAPITASPQVRVSGHTVTVSGCEQAEPIRMYDADGRLLHSIQADERGTARLIATCSGPIIVSTINRQFKLFLQP